MTDTTTFDWRSFLLRRSEEWAGSPPDDEDDKALVAVGRAGTGWSFAFDDYPDPFHEQWFVSPAADVSAGTRAVVVWSGLRARHGDGAEAERLLLEAVAGEFGVSLPRHAIATVERRPYAHALAHRGEQVGQDRPG